VADELNVTVFHERQFYHGWLPFMATKFE